MNRKHMWLILAGCVLVISAAGLAYTVWPSSPPDPATQSPEETASYVASKRFAKLDDAEKQNYLSQIQGRRELFQAAQNLSEENRQKLRENVRPLFRRAMADRVDKYFELPPEEQTSFLDGMIDRMETMHQGRPDRPAGERHRRPGFTPDRMKNMLENTPPESRAKFVEFMEAARKRRRERGLGDPHR
jgi:hypothetical protein